MCCVAWFSGELGYANLMVGLDLKVVLQPEQFYDSKSRMAQSDLALSSGVTSSGKDSLYTEVSAAS